MAVDKLVDSTVLDAGLTTVANAIRTKDGTSAQLGFPQGMADAISNISVGNDLVNHARVRNNGIAFTGGYGVWEDLGENVVINNPNMVLSNDAFSTAICKTIDLTVSEEITNMNSMFRGGSRTTTEKIIIRSSTKNVTTWTRAFGASIGNGLMGEIGNNLDMSAATAANYFFDIRIKKVTFKENTIPITIDVSSPYLDDESLVSIANGLNESAVGKTVTFHSDSTAKMENIMGVIGMDETSTFHIFTANPLGTVNLLDFIADTKGWTIA